MKEYMALGGKKSVQLHSGFVNQLPSLSSSKNLAHLQPYLTVQSSVMCLLSFGQTSTQISFEQFQPGFHSDHSFRMLSIYLQTFSPSLSIKNHTIILRLQSLHYM